MTVIHRLPEIHARATGAPEPRSRRKLPPIPTFGGGGRATIPAEVIAGIRWMSEHGFAQREIAALLRMNDHSVRAIVSGQTRLHIAPSPPQEEFWSWAAARWV